MRRRLTRSSCGRHPSCVPTPARTACSPSRSRPWPPRPTPATSSSPCTTPSWSGRRRGSGAAPPLEASFSEALAHLAAARGADALPHLELAIAAYDAAGQPLDVKRCVALRSHLYAAVRGLTQGKKTCTTCTTRSCGTSSTTVSREKPRPALRAGCERSASSRGPHATLVPQLAEPHPSRAPRRPSREPPTRRLAGEQRLQARRKRSLFRRTATRPLGSCGPLVDDGIPIHREHLAVRVVVFDGPARRSPTARSRTAAG